MLVFILTDLAVEREALRSIVRETAQESFNCISVDSDQSTSDTLLAISSRRVEGVNTQDFAAGLKSICQALAQDIVRNGEGVHHVMEVHVTSAPSVEFAVSLGKCILRSPLVKTAVAGNDPNVGRFLMAIGNFAKSEGSTLDFTRLKLQLGEEVIFKEGSFDLSYDKEKKLVDYLRSCELYQSEAGQDGITFQPRIRYPSHEQNVRLHLDLAMGSHQGRVWGGDLTHEYISANADYRS
ncbi:MAG: arginine biosynthesis protein ArgJ, partial [Proteobacteria bacterium]